MTNPRHGERTAIGVAVLGVLVLAAATPACSRQAEPAATESPSEAPVSATIMMDGHTHTISGAVECRTRRAQPTATPVEYGNQTTEVSAQDDSASLSFSFSDATPPDVNGFAVSLKVDGGSYEMPYQPVRSPTQLEASRQGKSYTVTGTGQALAPGQSVARELPFGVHVTCP
ncbi:lipoprotein LpqH [Mycobacterium spongiae]|uniref:Lipoprotein LppO n=1 Tax=Mycobacterium spongiae TaxID=886343 RepID=A0A975PXB8_9MYCO|nr:lipoprotein LpqH [Mycobacterium spongiae]QUR68096.1 hypothetical protein F6B93_14265 [Mycobacterium spongiae]